MTNPYNPNSDQQNTTPESVGATVPPQYGAHDHSFTLQAIMELQKSNGQLTEAISSLKTSIDAQTTKLDKVECSVSGIEKKIYAAGVVLVIVIAISGFFINKFSDIVVAQISATPVVQQNPNIQDTTKKIPTSKK